LNKIIEGIVAGKVISCNNYHTWMMIFHPDVQYVGLRNTIYYASFEIAGDILSFGAASVRHGSRIGPCYLTMIAFNSSHATCFPVNGVRNGTGRKKTQAEKHDNSDLKGFTSNHRE
jgi:hypothetical protein